MKCIALLVLVLFAATGVVAAQQPPAAKPSDVESIDAILDAAYDVISCPAGKTPDWDRFRSLFIPQARFIMAVSQADGAVTPQILGVSEFTAAYAEYVKTNGFFEKDVWRRAERFGHVAHVLSTYESRHAASEAKPFARGVNSFQLLNDGKRWWIVDIYWQEETAANPIPAEYLGGKK